MHAVLLFSAVIHAATLGLIAAHALRHWTELRRIQPPSYQSAVGTAGVLAAGVAVLGTLIISLARPFGTSLAGGLGAGIVAGIAFLLYLGAWPLPASPDGALPGVVARRTAASFVAIILAVELIAFCFTAALAIGS